MLCQKCGGTRDVREITVLDLQQSPPATETWRFCLCCLLYKGYWCSYHECVKQALLDPSYPSERLPYTIRLACVRCCREKTKQLEKSDAEGFAGIMERQRPDLIPWLEARAEEARLPRKLSRRHRLAFGLVLTSEFYRMPLERTVLQLSHQVRSGESRLIH